MLKSNLVAMTQNVKSPETNDTSVPPTDTALKVRREGREFDSYSAKVVESEKVSIEQSLILALPSRVSLSPGHEEPLNYFIGSNVLDTHVQMYAEIGTDQSIVATLSRDGENRIQTHLEPRSMSKPWRFSRESLAEIIMEAKTELEQFPDTKILEDE